MKGRNCFFFALISLIVIPTLSYSSTWVSDFEMNGLDGWEAIGNVSVVGSSYGPGLVDGGNFRVLLSTEGGVSKNELGSFLGITSQWFNYSKWVSASIGKASAIKKTFFSPANEYIDNIQYDEVRLASDNNEPIPLTVSYSDPTDLNVSRFYYGEGGAVENYSSSCPPFYYTGVWHEGTAYLYDNHIRYKVFTQVFIVFENEGSTSINGHLIDNIQVQTTGSAPHEVPESTTLLLLGIGFIGLAGIRKKSHD